jgi:hypothetical protein
MVAPFAAVVVASIFSAGSWTDHPHRTLSLHLIHRCPPGIACLRPRTVARMVDEVQVIWSYLDVRIVPIGSTREDTAAAGAAPLTVFLEEQYTPPGRSQGSVLASLHPPASDCDGALARVWVRNVRALVAAVHVDDTPFGNLPERLADLILGRALGRALAHEVGHYLLGTTHHAPRGLMRAQLVLTDLLEAPDPARYGLAPHERESLRPCRTNGTAAVADGQPRR